MKNLIQKATVVLGVALIAFTACKKEDINQVVTATTDDTELVALTNQASNDMTSTEVAIQNPEDGMAMLNEGLSADFLVEAADMEDLQGPAPATGTMDLRAFVKSHSFIACLRNLNLSDRQVAALKKSVAAYEDCKASAVKRAREIYHQLLMDYQAKFERIRQAFKDGKITREEFQTMVHRLRVSFREKLSKMQLAEKLDVALKHCYREFLGNVKSILTDAQWKAFLKCHLR